MDFLILDWLSVNSVGVGVFIASLVFFYILKTIVIVKLRSISQKTENDIDDFFIDLLKTFRLVFGVTIALVVSYFAEGVNPFAVQWISLLFIFVLTHQTVRSIDVVFDFVLKKATGGDMPASSLQGLKTVVRLLIWSIGLLVVLSNLGVNITSLVAGLGIGGIAVALAIQNVLGDVFSSFSLFFDKPFVAGDYILAGSHEGTVERIGMKTTRIDRKSVV